MQGFRCLAMFMGIAMALSTQAPEGRDPQVFADSDLQAKLTAGSRGVIYLWSPHMPFSVDGVAAISTAVRERGLELVLVLHPGSDLDFARREATRAKIPEAALRRLTASALLERGMTNHAPSIQLFGDGQIVGPILPGVRSVEGYLEFIDSFAQDLAR